MRDADMEICKGFLKEMCGTILDASWKKSIVTNVAKMITTERKWQAKKGSLQRLFFWKDAITTENIQIWSLLSDKPLKHLLQILGKDTPEKNPSSYNPEATAVKIYNIINPQRQRIKLGISALSPTSPAAPHPTGELVKRSSKSKIYESYSKISVLSSSARNRQSVQPPLHQDSLKIRIFRISTFQLEIPSLCRHCWPSCCSWLLMDWDSSVPP